MKQENFSAKTINDLFETIAEASRLANELYNKEERDFEDEINL